MVSAALLLTLCAHTQAHVTKIVIDARAIAFGGRSFGNVGTYEILRGRAFGEVDPTDRRNTIIQDIGLAPRNARGRVEYISTFTVLKPVDVSKRNGVLFYEVANRGNAFFSEDDPGEDLLYKRGYTILSTGWQGDVTPIPAADKAAAKEIQSIAVPRAKNAHGSAITGPFLVRIPHLDSQGPTGDLMKLDQGALGNELPSSKLRYVQGDAFSSSCGNHPWPPERAAGPNCEYRLDVGRLRHGKTARGLNAAVESLHQAIDR
jgi:hypothetical protein